MHNAKLCSFKTINTLIHYKKCVFLILKLLYKTELTRKAMWSEREWELNLVLNNLTLTKQSWFKVYLEVFFQEVKVSNMKDYSWECFWTCHNSLNTLTVPPTSNVIFVYFILTFAVILCKYNIYHVLIDSVRVCNFQRFGL